jgi:amino acid transporter
MITAGIVISLAGNLNVLILAGSRILFAIAEKGDLPASMARIHPRFRTPAISVVFTTTVMLLLAVSGTFIYLVTLSTIARLVTYFATCSALPVLRRRPGAPPAAFRAPAGIWMAAAGMLVCVWLVSNTTLHELRDALLATSVGLALYGFHRAVNRSTGRPGGIGERRFPPGGAAL